MSKTAYYVYFTLFWWISATNYTLITPPPSMTSGCILPTQAKLSEEDEVLKERVDKLNEEVNVLNTSTALRHLHTQRGSGHQTNVSSIPWKSASFSGGCHSRMPSSPSSVPLLLVSSSSQDHLDRLEEVEAVQNNQTVLHCTAINGIVENPGVIGIDSANQNADSSTKSTVLHNLSPLPIS